MCECGESWCSDECAEENGFIQDNCKLGYEVIEGYEQNEECEKESCENCDNFTKGGCNYCRQEDFEDAILLQHALKLLNMDRNNLIDSYKDQNERQVSSWARITIKLIRGLKYEWYEKVHGHC